MNLGKTFDSILPVLGQLAPNIATMIGGPLAGMAVTALAGALGLSPEQSKDPATIIAAVQGMTPQIAAAIKKADQDFMIRMKELDLEPEKLGNADRSDARNMEIQTKDYTPKILAFVITAGFFGLLGILCHYTIPPENVRIIDVILGALASAFLAVIQFYFGSSSSSQNKDATIKQMASTP